MEKLYIIDAVNFLFRSYFAIGPMTNPKGESTNALFGFIRSLNKIIKEFSPTHLIAVFDGPDNKRSRTEIYGEYKAHRTEMPGDLFSQLEQALVYCELASIPLLMVPGVEADDTIGAIAKWAEKQGTTTFICSSDKDLCQLVSDTIFIINPHKDDLLIDKIKVKELFGVTPEQIVDYLAIVGDTSDNIPGLEGFGAKTAAALLTEFGSLDFLLEHPEKVSGKKGEILRRDREIALLGQRLATVDITVPFPQNEDFFKLKKEDLTQLKLFFQEMHFLSLLRELEENPSHIIEKVDYSLIANEEELTACIATLSEKKEIALSIEATLVNPIDSRMTGISFSTQSQTAWYLPFNGTIKKERIVKAIKPLLENPTIGFCGHNIKQAMHLLLNEGISLKKIAFDTLIASYLLAPEHHKHSLSELMLAQFNKQKMAIETLTGTGKKEIPLNEVAPQKMSDYGCESADYTFRLMLSLKKELENRELSSLFYTIELPLIPVLLNMERAGIYIDLEQLKRMSLDLTAQIKAYEAKIFSLTGEEFNINSPKQLGIVLFEKLGIKPYKKTTTGYSTAADILESLKTNNPVIQTILDYRVLEKLRSTYVDALPQQISLHTQRIHCTFNQAIAATGRLACQNPNLQNIPIRTEEGRKIRTAFQPEKKGWSYLAADYSQIELRLLAHLSEDPSLIKAFEAGEDIHAFTASLVFNIPLSQVTPAMRHQAKAVNFGILYGQQAFGLSQGLDIAYNEAAAFIDTYFQRYQKVKEFFESCKEKVRQTGYATTLSGRKRPIPEINNRNPLIRSQAERLAMNTPLQGTAADLIKIAMIKIDHLLKNDNYLGFMNLQIHDELLFELPDEEIASLSLPIKKIMETVFCLKVPLIVDISIGKNWGEC